MGVTERRTRERESMRAKILDAALQLYLDRGLEQVSIRNIAERIEFSAGTIYLYFRDKDQIFFALYNLAFGRFYEEQLKLEPITDPYERLYQGCRQYISWGIENAKLYDLMFIAEIPMNVIAREECEDIGRRSFELLRQTVTDCIDEGRIRIRNVDLASTMIWNMLHGIVSLIIKRRVLIPQDQVQAMVTAMLDNFLLFLKR